MHKIKITVALRSADTESKIYLSLVYTLINSLTINLRNVSQKMNKKVLTF